MSNSDAQMIQGSASGTPVITTVTGTVTVTGAVTITETTPVPATDSMSNPTAGQRLAYPFLFNGATWDRMQSNTDITLLPLLARTGTIQTADQLNANGVGVIVWLVVTIASGTGGLTVLIQGKDPVSLNYVNLTTSPTAVIATGTKHYQLFPSAQSAVGGITNVTNNILPRTWRVNVSHGDASSYTYSLGACTVGY